VSVTEWVRVW